MGLVKGKEYYTNVYLKFEGEYINGKKWNGKGYNDEKQLIYELFNGYEKIKEYDDNGK